MSSLRGRDSTMWHFISYGGLAGPSSHGCYGYYSFAGRSPRVAVFRFGSLANMADCSSGGFAAGTSSAVLHCYCHHHLNWTEHDHLLSCWRFILVIHAIIVNQKNLRELGEKIGTSNFYGSANADGSGVKPERVNQLLNTSSANFTIDGGHRKIPPRCESFGIEGIARASF